MKIFKDIICFHLFNDFSGSPKVLYQNIEGLLSLGRKITLVTSKGGVLDQCKGDNLQKIYFKYKFSENRVVTTLRFIIAQIDMFFYGLKYGRNKIFYVNTILPFGASIASKILGVPLIYHYHENAKAKGAFYRTLCWLMVKTADKIICVSEDQASTLPQSDKIIVIPNAIPRNFEIIDNFNTEDAFRNKRILMLCSLKKYKGIKEFWHLAELLPQYNFEIVINDSDSNIEKYIIENRLSNLSNVKWFSKQSDVLKFYLRAAIVLNLSNKDEFIETFGLTAIESIACGRPIIGPTVGGISEIIVDGFNGFKIDSHNLTDISNTIEYILSSEDTYKRFCTNSLSLKSKYSGDNIIYQINYTIGSI